MCSIKLNKQIYSKKLPNFEKRVSFGSGVYLSDNEGTMYLLIVHAIWLKLVNKAYCWK
jgi:hypothetical protein